MNASTLGGRLKNSRLFIVACMLLLIPLFIYVVLSGYSLGYAFGAALALAFTCPGVVRSVFNGSFSLDLGNPFLAAIGLLGAGYLILMTLSPVLWLLFSQTFMFYFNAVMFTMLFVALQCALARWAVLSRRAG
ncbi:hypothetical protein [Tropheryma whipplei]|uniref:Uncharacterized protein n=1 Tax=Tropheryma whipplei (strain Twist) TaxID=203267 RepID=Q83H21_TROWT|nr:hypothetical protein [Tropheryma whipplei]AAO44139.1 unknown [Tropheryma whipplei str. Twist]CAD66738.1 putative integral membrane protein [Tropheryma whipplei TW08/27]